jgi:hypothetical protein
MNTKFCSLLAGASLIALAGAANAREAVALSDGQLDGVTAGAAATAAGQALALGDFLTLTQTVTATDAVSTLTVTNPGPNNTTVTTYIPGVALGQSFTLAAAASALFQAAVATSSQSAATLP